MTGNRFRKVLVANRGEIALRIINACKDLDIRTVGVYANNDHNQLIEKACDEYLNIAGNSLSSTYLNIDKIIRTAKKAKADAIHPGYGFLAENPLLAKACERNSITFIGPSSTVLQMTADKPGARRLAQDAGIKTMPGTDEIQEESEASKFAQKQGYPIIIKSCFGGGGRGIRIVNSRKELTSTMRKAKAEAENSRGDTRIYAEKYFHPARHIEFQFMADKRGNTVNLLDRECSIQRRFQKLIEEAPSPAIDQKTRHRIGEKVCELARRCGFSGVGTAEFLLGQDGEIRFMEINPRIQVEHGVTEMVTGTDLVKEQIMIAQGQKLQTSQAEVKQHGHAMECRIVAESARMGFAPSSGTIRHLHFGDLPTRGRQTRIESALYNGAKIDPNYDSLMAKLLVWGRSREQAIKSMDKALGMIHIDGVQNTIDFYRFLIRHKEFQKGKLSTTFIQDNRLVEEYTKKTLKPDIAAAIAVAIYQHESNHKVIEGKSRWVENSLRESAGYDEENQ
jgi:acetyl/propionyl-CoA carboxylase alpha subunit